jgi:hypothetical protein
MTADLRAFLYFLDASGDCRVSAFSQADSLISAMRDACASPDVRGVVHIGFWYPSPAEVIALLKGGLSGLLVSDAASGALAPRLPVEAAAVGCLRGVVFRRVLKDWVTLGGWDAPAQAKPSAAAAEPQPRDYAAAQPSRRVSTNWVADLAANGGEEVASEVAEAGIVDENSYLALEAGLPSELRAELGVLRFAILSGLQADAHLILDRLSACPPWLLGLPLDRLALTVRQANVFKTHGFNRLEDLMPLGTAGLRKLPNLGQGSIDALGKTVTHALESGLGLSAGPLSDGSTTAPKSEDVAQATGWDSLRSGLGAVDRMLNDVEREVWAGRFGHDGEQLTLAALGERLQLSMERVRQVERQIQRKLRQHPFWEHLAARIEMALSDRQTALLIEGLAGIDPWFEAETSLERALAGTLEHMLPHRLGVHRISERLAVSRLLAHEWDEVRDVARDVLEAAAKGRLTEAEVRRQCDQLLAGRGEDRRDGLWAEVTARCIWTGRPGEARRLVSLGDSVVAVLQAVLESADEPLHFMEIHRRAERIVPGYELRYVQNALPNVGILYDRGTYGLPKHCPLDSEALSLVRSEAEELMLSGDATRQWHATELCDAMMEKGMGFDGQLTPYILNFALKDSTLLVDLRRMVWGLGTAWQEGAASRVDVRTAVIALLQEHGGPMTTDEIRRQLAAVRGVNQSFQIHPAGPLVRVGPGLWDLVKTEDET